MTGDGRCGSWSSTTSELIRDGIASLLGIQPGITVVGTAADGRDGGRAGPGAASRDVVLMDVRMPEMDGVEAAAILRAARAGCRVVMLTTFDDEEYVVQALRAGATGYLLKDLPARRARRRGPAGARRRRAVRLGRGGAAGVGAGPAGRRPAAAPADRPLTAREIEVLRLVARGLDQPRDRRPACTSARAP